MILGIGADLIDIRRMENTLERFGPRFTNRVYTATEQAVSDRRAERTASYAKRWAAKEACSKALGTGLRMGIKWKEMGVVNLETGKPVMVLEGDAAARLKAMTPHGFVARVDVTITDDHPLAQAFVVISAWPEGWGAAAPQAPAS